MQLQNAYVNSSQFRRTNSETQHVDIDESKASRSTSEPASAQDIGQFLSNSELLNQLSDKAALEFRYSVVNSTKTVGPELGELVDSLSTDARAATLFAGVDVDNPTLVANQDGFDLQASQGLEDSTYIDLGDGAELFVFTDLKSGNQIAYHVENGQLGARIEAEGDTIAIGNGISINIGKSPTGNSEINFLQSGSSSLLFWRSHSSMTLNSDNSLFTVKSRDGGFGFLRGLTRNSFDVQSGAQLVIDGKADPASMSAQQQFDYYADTPQGARLLRIEGDFYQSDIEKRLFVARVQYLRGDGGAEVFNEFTPRRATLTGDDLTDYDAAVQDMMVEMLEQGVYSSGVAGSEAVDSPIDESMLYILASSAVEAYGESPEALDAIKDDIGSWIISTDNADGIAIVTDSGTSFSAGWYNGSTGTVQFSIEWLVYDYTRPDDAFELVTYELAHSLDNVDEPRPGWLDGIPPGLSDTEIATLIAERERLFELAYPGLDVDSSVNQDFNTVADNSGFRNYTFFNRKEFWAELTATFLGSDAGAETVRNASPELYNMLRSYYGREDLPRA